MSKEKIQDIVIKHPKKTAARPPEKEWQPTRRFRFPKMKGKLIFGVLVFIFTLILGTKAINAFSKATIQVKLHQEIIQIDTILKAGKGETLDMPYETMELQVEKEKTAPATGVETVEKKANGQIVIYNAYSSAPQTLVSGTRFETPDGKIYRTANRVTVPGTTVENGKIIPGSVETLIYADKPGEEYNIGLSDFTVPAFKDSPRYEKFYARSKTPMSGGFKGEMPVISEQDRQTLESELKKSIEEELFRKAAVQKPKNYVFFPKAIKLSFTDEQPLNQNPNAPKDTQVFTLKKTGKLAVYLFPEEKLFNVLVKKYLGEDFVGKIKIQNPETLNFDLVSADAQKEVIIFKLQGEAKFIWTVNEEELKKSLIASSKKTEDLEKIFKEYAAIERASIVFWPSWWHFFPNKASKIEVKQIIP